MKMLDDYKAISIPNIIRYLKLQGWDRKANFPSNKLIVFDGPDDINGEKIQAVIPANQNFRDYAARVKELIESLSELEGRPIKDILTDMLNPNVDKLQVRVLSDISKDGTLPFGYAAKLISGLKDLLISAACVEENPQPFYRRATKVGLNYADNCRFGQTKVGSFIITIESLVPSYSAHPQQLSLPIDDEEMVTEPFNRRVIKRIQRGISLVEKSVSEGDVAPIVDHYKAGLNANMCEALLGLKLDQLDVDLEYSVNWSLNIPEPNDVPNKVKIEGIAFDYIESAAKVLRNTDESVKRKIVGKVVKLSASDLEDEDDQYGNRLITIKTEINDRPIKVNVPLNLDDYKQACNAHRDNKDVTVQGIIERVGGKWQLMSPERFQVSEPTK
ncbi:hypothetical protein [Heyndrickxia acidiproducens]|uniref:hypothetical protein n=1 Tax=Heyndrickxia acidiproducens TaxID=1121084 RepID=UPI000372A2FA|nr:hypothetical protein [Heyndrickxia acidiproducens]